MIRRRGNQRRRRGAKSPARRLLDLFLVLAVLGLTALIAARVEHLATQTLAGQAVVNDGDSLTIGSERIRLKGIDAPEWDQTCHAPSGSYRCGRESASALREHVRGRPVSCEGWERDRYGRLLAVCSVGGVDLNRRQVADGWAVAYGAYDEEERQARAQQVGLWQGEFDRPRDWRTMRGDAGEGVHDLIGMILNALRALFAGA